MSKLTVHKRLHLERDSATFSDPFVRCPTERRWASVDICRGCAEATTVDESGTDAHVRCSKEDASGADASHVPIAEAMDFEVLTVGADVHVEDVLLALETRALSMAVVLDHAGHAIGMCSRLELARAQNHDRVDAVMSPFVLTLLANANVADAIEMILEREVHYIPVLAQGRVMGIVSSTSALRWSTQNLRPTRRPRAFDATTR